jgi:dimethylargininase
MREMLHLKSGTACLEQDMLLTAGEFIQHPEFETFRKIIVEKDESYAANCIRVNDFVLVPEGFPKTSERITEAGFSVIQVDVSEFRKLDGGLSCLSLRF